jgi:hypothetical protein
MQEYKRLALRRPVGSRGTLPLVCVETSAEGLHGKPGWKNLQLRIP